MTVLGGATAMFTRRQAPLDDGPRGDGARSSPYYTYDAATTDESAGPSPGGSTCGGRQAQALFAGVDEAGIVTYFQPDFADLREWRVLPGGRSRGGAAELPGPAPGVRDAAFDGIVNAVVQRGRELRIVAARVMGDPDDAADVVHQALAEALARRDRLRPGASPFAFVWAFVVNVARTERRRRAVRAHVALDDALEEAPEHEPPITAQSAADEVVQSELVCAVRKAVDSLPARQRAAVDLVYLRGLTVAEAAAILSVRADALRQALARGRASLESLLRDLAR